VLLGAGIGRAQAIALSKSGATVVIVGRRAEPLEAVQKEIGCHILPGSDVGTPPPVTRATLPS
jgi:NADP-dependent 3-hydroxy acid dehydrogenase YdfG